MQSPSTTKELEQLRAQYGVTVKVVKAQGEYISDLESKNLALTKHIKEGKSDDPEGDTARRLADLKRGVEYYKAQNEQAKKIADAAAKAAQNVEKVIDVTASDPEVAKKAQQAADVAAKAGI